MNRLVNVLSRLGLLTEDIDYHLIRASMVLIFLSFGYQKWFAYEAQVLIPYISHGPLIFWLYPVFGIRAPAGFSAFPSGSSERCCCSGSGTSGLASSARLARPLRSS